MTSASRSKGEDVAPDFGRVPSEPGSREPSPTVSALPGFDPSRDRGIRIGKSWPRPATPCDLVPRWEGEFISHADWVSFASKRLTVGWDSNGYDLPAICVDAFGRRCANGRDMKRAADEGAFPVRYFWNCWPANRDSDGSGEAGKTGTGLTEGDSADPKGIAPAVSHLTDQEGQNR